MKSKIKKPYHLCRQNLNLILTGSITDQIGALGRLHNLLEQDIVSFTRIWPPVKDLLDQTLLPKVLDEVPRHLAAHRVLCCLNIAFLAISRRIKSTKEPVDSLPFEDFSLVSPLLFRGIAFLAEVGHEAESSYLSPGMFGNTRDDHLPGLLGILVMCEDRVKGTSPRVLTSLPGLYFHPSLGIISQTLNM
jgi:hypothetical protein